MSEAHGKRGSWRAMANAEISRAMAKRRASRRERRAMAGLRTGFEASERDVISDEQGGTRSVHRQLFELQSRGERIEGALRHKKALESEIQREREKEASIRFHERKIIDRWAQKARQSCLGEDGVERLFSIAARELARQLPYFTSEDIEYLGECPVSLKRELLKQAALITAFPDAQDPELPIITDEVAAGLLDSSAIRLELRHAAITDDFFKLLSPKIMADNNVEASDNWEESVSTLHFDGALKLRELDLSFCRDLSEDCVPSLSSNYQGISSLSLAGLCNNGDPLYYPLSHLCKLPCLQFLDLSSCVQLSLLLLTQSGLLCGRDVSPLPYLKTIIAIECPLITSFINGHALPQEIQRCTSEQGDESCLSCPSCQPEHGLHFDLYITVKQELFQSSDALVIRIRSPDTDKKRVLRLIAGENLDCI